MEGGGPAAKGWPTILLDSFQKSCKANSELGWAQHPRDVVSMKAHTLQGILSFQLCFPPNMGSRSCELGRGNDVGRRQMTEQLVEA